MKKNCSRTKKRESRLTKTKPNQTKIERKTTAGNNETKKYLSKKEGNVDKQEWTCLFVKGFGMIETDWTVCRIKIVYGHEAFILDSFNTCLEILHRRTNFTNTTQLFLIIFA